MNYEFNAYADYERVIRQRLDKLCSKFSRYPETVINISTSPLNNGRVHFDIEIATPVVRFNGYHHVATLKIETIENEGKYEDINIVFPANGHQNENFSRYYEEGFRCDHCHTNRYRKTVHLFRDESGKDLMVASTCAKSYFGENVFRLLGLYEMFSPDIIGRDIEDIFIGFGGGVGHFNTVDYCKYAYGSMKKSNAYVSRHKKEEMELYGSYILSTTDKTNILFNKINPYLTEEEKQNIIKTREECKKLAESFDITDIKNFWFDKYHENTDDNFYRSCFLNLSMLDPKRGLLVYAVSAYMREIEGAFNCNVGDENSRYIGKIGERLKNITATISFISIRETLYGLSTTIKFIDVYGNILVWFASGKHEYDINIKVSLTGTVKKHDEYKGKKQTILNRCKIEENL